MDTAQLASGLESNTASADHAALSISASSSISDLFSSAPTLVLSLAQSGTQAQADPPAQPDQQSVEPRLDWDAVDRLGHALDGSGSR